MSRPKKEPQAKTSQASKAVIQAATVNDTIAAISLVEVAINSLEMQDIGSPEQEVLKLAITKLWALHDILIEVEVVADDDDDDDDAGDL